MPFTLAVGSQTNENRLSGLQDTILEALTDLDDHLQKACSNTADR